MWAIVTVSFLGSPHHVWNYVLGEGSSSLNHLLSHWPVHQSYSIWMVGHAIEAGRWSCWCFVVVFVWCVWSRSTVVSGETPAWWESAVWGVSSVMVCPWASVAWCAAVWGLVIGSRVHSLRVTATVTPKSGVMGMGSRSAEPVPVSMVTVLMPITMVIPRCGSITSSCVRVVVSVSCWYAWWQNFVGAICCNMAIIIAVKTSYVRVIACHVARFLALKAFIIIARHGIYWWWW